MTSIVAIVPLYNGAPYIEESLRSILAQERKADDIVVVDDGSTDGGAGTGIVRALAADHPEIRLLHKDNGGQGSARNFGVANSSSDLIALLDQDDEWYPHHLKRLEEVFAQNDDGNLGWVYSNFDRRQGTSKTVTRRILDLSSRTEHPKRTLEGCLAADMLILPSGSLISRKAFDAVGGFDPQFIGYEDDDLFLRIFVAGFRNVYLNEALTVWRSHPASASHSAGRMPKSRRLYYEKLSASFPASFQPAISPRFAKLAIDELIFSTATLNPDGMKSAIEQYMTYSRHLTPVQRILRFIGYAPGCAYRLAHRFLSRRLLGRFKTES